MLKLRRLNCSFCRKNEDEVLKLVSGPRVYICDECVAIANRLMTGDDGTIKTSVPTVWRRLIDGARRLFQHASTRRIDYFNVT